VLPPISPLARRRAGHGVALLVWHDLVPTAADKLVWFDTPVALFEAQIARLSRAGARPITLDALYAYLAGGAPVPPPGAVVLCFDDNTVGIHEFAAPRLQKRGWPWALSVHTKYVGVTTRKTHNTYDALREMERTAGANIVSQTHTHPPDLRTFSDSTLRFEMQESRRLLERQLAHPVRYVTYPSGHWDRRVAEAAQTAGYRLGLTEDNGDAESSPHLLGIHRFSTHRRFEEAVQAVTRGARAR
jgi:biofilm PGA synthesis lipoprotein PgaB